MDRAVLWTSAEMCISLHNSCAYRINNCETINDRQKSWNLQDDDFVSSQVALKGMFVQAKQLVKFWKLSKSDAIIWIVTFLIVTLVNIDIGLLAGLLVSLVIILLQTIRSYTCLLGHIPHTDLYLDLDRYKAVSF